MPPTLTVQLRSIVISRLPGSREQRKLEDVPARRADEDRVSFGRERKRARVVVCGREVDPAAGALVLEDEALLVARQGVLAVGQESEGSLLRAERSLCRP